MEANGDSTDAASTHIVSCSRGCLEQKPYCLTKVPSQSCHYTQLRTVTFSTAWLQSVSLSGIEYEDAEGIEEIKRSHIEG